MVAFSLVDLTEYSLCQMACKYRMHDVHYNIKEEHINTSVQTAKLNCSQKLPPS